MAQEYTVGSFSAKQNLSKLLAVVRAGDSFVICIRGVPSARLVPFEQPEEQQPGTTEARP